MFTWNWDDSGQLCSDHQGEYLSHPGVWEGRIASNAVRETRGQDSDHRRTPSTAIMTQMLPIKFQEHLQVQPWSDIFLMLPSKRTRVTKCSFSMCWVSWALLRCLGGFPPNLCEMYEHMIRLRVWRVNKTSWIVSDLIRYWHVFKNFGMTRLRITYFLIFHWKTFTYWDFKNEFSFKEQYCLAIYFKCSWYLKLPKLF